jgi:Uma2 family endonuclease
VARAERPIQQIFRTPPQAAIEILSPENRFSAMQKTMDDYLAFGVRNIWVIDPRERRALICGREGWAESKDLVLRSVDEIFGPIDQ